MMTGGIDSLLNNRMAAGRQDPQYLMNSYQQNNDLLDLLALQKLKSEKEAAARQMALEGGGTPPTVREQREQELVQMNKNELAQQVGGVAQKQMGDQQQAMQKLVKGIGGQNVPMMAQGGIVGYDGGGEVDSRLHKLTQQLIEAGMEPEAARASAERTLNRGFPTPPMPGLPSVPNLLPDPTAPARAAFRGVRSLMDNIPGGPPAEDRRANGSDVGTPLDLARRNPQTLDEIVPQNTGMPAEMAGDGSSPTLDRLDRRREQVAEERAAARAALPSMSDDDIYEFIQNNRRADVPFSTEGTNLGRVRDALKEGDHSLLTAATAYPTSIVMDFLETQRGMGEDIGRGVELARQGVSNAATQVGEGVDLARGPRAQEQPEVPSGTAQSEVASGTAQGAPIGQENIMPERQPPRGEGAAVGPQATPAQWLSANATRAAPQAQTPAAPQAQQGGIGGLAEQMQRLEGQRDSKMGAFADWAGGIANAKHNTTGMALAGGSDALRDRGREFDTRMADLIKADAGLQLDQQRADTEQDRNAVQRENMDMEVALAEKGWEREDARYASEREIALAEAVRKSGTDPAQIVQMFRSLLDNMMPGEATSERIDEAMQKSLYFAQLMSGTVTSNPRQVTE